MKSLEELERLNKDTLIGIANELGASPKTNLKKDKLVHLVYDLQQPDVEPSEVEGTAEYEPVNEIDLGADLENVVAFIEETFGGIARDTGNTEDKEGVPTPVYEVTDMAGDVIVGGTIAELHARALDVLKEEKDAAALDAESATQGEPQPEEAEPEEAAPTGEYAELEKQLKVLRNFGLRYELGVRTIKLIAGSKAVTTTLDQPERRIVATAKQLCNAPTSV